MIINPSMIRLTWGAIEETQSHHLLTLTDTALVRLILQQVARKILLSREEAYALHEYISSKTPLIRDMAESRLTPRNEIKELSHKN